MISPQRSPGDSGGRGPVIEERSGSNTKVVLGQRASGPRSRVESLREAFFLHTHALLRDDTVPDLGAAAARDYLHARGFDPPHLDCVPAGLFPDVATVKQRLLESGFSIGEINASHLLADERLPGRLVGPIRDMEGRIVSFWARHPENHPPRCLYLSGDWKRQVPLFGLETALGPAEEGEREIFIVEDILDALLLHSRGVARVAAIGNTGSELTAERWERLAAVGIQRVTLILGERRSAGPGTMAAIENAARARIAPAVFLLPAERRPEAMGPGELLRSWGRTAFESLVRRGRVHGFRYKALTILAGCRPDGPWTEAARAAALDQAVEFYWKASPHTIPQLDAFFVPPILRELGLEGNLCGPLPEPPLEKAEWSEAPEPPQEAELPPEEERPAEIAPPALAGILHVAPVRQVVVFVFGLVKPLRIW